MLLSWKAKHVGFCWSKIWMPFLMPSQQCPTHACVVVYSKRCVHDVGRVTRRQCIINCSIFSTAHWLTLSTEYTDSDVSRGVTSHLPGVAAYFMLLLFMWHKSYFDVVLCPSSSQILATNAQISFSCKPRPPQCLLAQVPKVTPSKNPRSANDRAGSMKRSGVCPSDPSTDNKCGQCHADSRRRRLNKDLISQLVLTKITHVQMTQQQTFRGKKVWIIEADF